MKRLTILLLVCLAFVLQSSAAVRTFYIDWVGGSDTANDFTAAQSKTTPWKTCPQMNNASGHSGYTHVAGDQFIFKGGVTWPAACFRITVNDGGDSSHSDYYGVDKTWYSGGSWTQPTFDAQSNTSVDQFFYFYTDYVTIDNINFANYKWTGDPWPCAMISFEGHTYLVVANCNFKSWTHSGTSDSLHVIYGSTTQPCTGDVITNCVFDGTVGGGNNGWAGYDVPTARHCIVTNMTAGFYVTGDPGEVSYCQIGPINQSYDPANHEAGIEQQGGSAGRLYVFNNILHDCIAETLMMGSPGTEAWVYNNLFYNPLGSDDCMNVDVRLGDYILHAYNNTYYCQPYALLLISGPGGTPTIDARNNLVIADSFAGGIGNLSWTVSEAEGYGYTFDNLWQPPYSTSPTVGKGVNLTSLNLFTNDLLGVARPASGAWDVGAYQFSSGGGTDPIISARPSSLSFGSVLIGTTNTGTITVQNIGGGTLTGSVSIYGSGPFYVVSGGSYSLGASELQTVTIEYRPTAQVSDSATLVFTGGGGASVPVSGSGYVVGVRYVDNTATGANNGSSWTDAWTSFGAINWANVNAGDTIYISGGASSQTYNATLNVSKSGSAGKPITIQVGNSTGHNGKVIIDAQSTRSTCINAGTYSYLTFSGDNGTGSTNLVLQNALNASSLYSGIGFYSSSGNNIICRNMEIQDCNNGFSFGSTSGNKVLYSYLHGIQGDHGIYMDGGQAYDLCEVGYCIIQLNNITGNPGIGPDGISGGSGITLHDCYIYGADGPGVVGAAHMDACQPIGNYWKVYNNLVENMGNGCFEGGTIGSSWNNIKVYNNVFRLTDSSLSYYMRGFEFSPNSALSTVHDIYVVNNTFVDLNWRAVSWVWSGQTPTVSSVVFANNIFYNCGVDSPLPKDVFYIDVDASAPQSSYTVDYNDVNAGSIGYSLLLVNGTSFTQTHGQGGAPTFVSYTIYGAANNLALSQSDTACINHGTNAVAWGIPATDKDGNVRPFGSAWDIGAYEYNSTIPPDSAPIITNEPSGGTNCPPNGVTLTVGASGYPALSYQWRVRGTNQAGATRSSYAVTDTNLSADSWYCYISNRLGTTNSYTNTVLITNAIYFVSQPVSTNCLTNTKATFTVYAKGQNSLNYQWYLGSTATNVTTRITTNSPNQSNYVISAVKPADAKFYRCRVVDSFPTPNTNYSSVAQLTVVSNIPPSNAIIAPANQEIHNTNTADNVMYYGPFTNLTLVSVSGPGPFTYQWRKSGVNILGANSTSYRPSLTNGAIYTLVVSNTSGSCTSGNAQVLVGIQYITQTEYEWLGMSGLAPAPRPVGLSP